ncbi:right-handed parallel beta-helix repeat-containing protein [Flavihumibacter fluvii]|uniref:right-handed parallel beta-helix repeat-containing protein n=1 Tax=Flavihumibacter fluvii TaxID=2838157 RepID=UPI001BDE9ACC|nr:right-handed parallel beta-helix repeat-containing protein [Flavihumibacter fluvii]ULQ52411.1 right-handed parallel beta-helix repeat-containing protein [Flavihumibacter fluvii]
MRYLLVALLFVSCSKEIVPEIPAETVPPSEQVIVIPQYPNYYITEQGSSANDGRSPLNAWNLEKANAFTFQPGDTINIVGQVQGSLMLDESGSRNLMITIRGGELLSAEKNGILLYNNDHILVKDMVIQGGGKMSTSISNSGIILWSDDNKRHANIMLDHVVAKGYSYAGIASGLALSDAMGSGNEAAMSYAGGYDSVIVKNCVADSNGFAGINMTGLWPGKQNRDIVILNSTASHNRGIKGMRPHSGNGIILANAVNGIIDSCSANNNGWENGHANVGIWTYTAENVVIQHSASFSNRSTTGVDGGGFDIDGGTWNCTMQYNLAYDNDGAGFLIYEYGDPNGLKGATCRYNISNNDGRSGPKYGGISIGGTVPIRDVMVYNNTIVQDKGQAITKLGNSVEGIFDVKNNILSAPKSPYLSPGAENNYLGNAILDNDFIPMPNSPVIDNGLEFSGLPSRDFYANIINGKRDIGAVER